MKADGPAGGRSGLMMGSILCRWGVPACGPEVL